MRHHLALVKTLGCVHPIRSNKCSDMDIILAQAWLLDAGSVTFKAIKAGEIADILAGVVALAYNALHALVLHDLEITEHVTENYKTYQMLAMMQQLSEKIYRCSSGEPVSYIELYYLCKSLAANFLNADFDKAFLVYHEWVNAVQLSPDKVKAQRHDWPDLTDCLYE